MKTQSEMREDFYRNQKPAMLNTPFLEFKQSPSTPTGLVKPLDGPHIIPKGTIVLVADKSLRLRQHFLANDHSFMYYQSGNAPKLESSYTNGEYPTLTDPSQLLAIGWYTFETQNSEWPYMVVPKSLLMNTS